MKEHVCAQVTFHICIQEVPGSNLGRATGYPDQDIRGHPRYSSLTIIFQDHQTLYIITPKPTS
jgi:hypothetical protein